jgi:primosomal protein N' (replication factor Y)
MISTEQGIRKATGFPPFMHIARCVVSSSTDKDARDASLLLASSIKVPAVDILGPAPTPIARIRNRYRWHLILRSKNRAALHSAIEGIEQVELATNADLRIDVDPYTML